MSDHLDELLGGLTSTPVPPLAEGALVRRRGEQRRRRTRAALTVTSAAVLVLGGVGAASLVGGDGRATVEQLAPSSTPTCAATGCIEPSPGDARPTAVPTAASARGAVPLSLLLRPEDAAAVAGGSWTAGPISHDGFSLLQVCATVDVGGTAGSWRSLDRDDGVVVVNQVVNYPGRSLSVLESLRADVVRCPLRPDDSTDGKASSSFALGRSPDGSTVVVRQTSRDCDACTPVVHVWVVTLGEQGSISYTSLPETESARTAAWATAARNRLGCPGDGCPGGRPASFPAAVTPRQGHRVFGVYLAVARDPRSTAGDAALEKARNQARGAGYAASTGDLACDQGAAGALGLDPRAFYSKAVVYFATAAAAKQFVDAYQPGVVGTAEVKTFCLD